MNEGPQVSFAYIIYICYYQQTNHKRFSVVNFFILYLPILHIVRIADGNIEFMMVMQTGYIQLFTAFDTRFYLSTPLTKFNSQYCVTNGDLM